MAGLRAAQHEFVSFVDDDNWIASDWVAQVEQIMNENSHLGAVGGLIKPQFEITPPEWFSRFQLYYALVDSHEPPRPPVSLCGAGLTIRKSAWEQLINAGFRPIIPDRVGTKLISGGDTELTLALNLAGWTIAIDERLALSHWIPADRLIWAYLCRLISLFRPFACFTRRVLPRG